MSLVIRLRTVIPNKRCFRVRLHIVCVLHNFQRIPSGIYFPYSPSSSRKYATKSAAFKRHVPRNRRGSASRLCCPSRLSLRSRDPSSVRPGPCRANSPRSCTEKSGIRSRPNAVSETVGNRGNRVRGDARSRRTANYSVSSAFGGFPRTACHRKKKNQFFYAESKNSMSVGSFDVVFKTILFEI